MQVLSGNSPPEIIFVHPRREPVIIYDYSEALRVALELCEALKVFPEHTPHPELPNR